MTTIKAVNGKLWTIISDLTSVNLPQGRLDYAVLCDRPNQPYCQFAVLQKITATGKDARCGVIETENQAAAVELLAVKIAQAQAAKV